MWPLDNMHWVQSSFFELNFLNMLAWVSYLNVNISGCYTSVLRLWNCTGTWLRQKHWTCQLSRGEIFMLADPCLHSQDTLSQISLYKWGNNSISKDEEGRQRDLSAFPTGIGAWGQGWVPGGLPKVPWHWHCWDWQQHWVHQQMHLGRWGQILPSANLAVAEMKARE